jgi:glycosyltransferase involved in cell wall biosynthesis
MRLLIVTQSIDLDDPILGFFHRWVEELADRVVSVEVICLKLGRHALPANVRVHSLGKEKGGRSKIACAFSFLWLVWSLRNKYDRVFVHMNPEYVILAGLKWRFLKKKVTFWYNHPAAGRRFSLAAKLAHQILYTSPYAATAKVAGAVQMPVGIDTDLFRPSGDAKMRSAFYMQGRITPSKKVAMALEALQLVRKSATANLTLVGPEDPIYGNELRKKFAELIKSNIVTFAGEKQNDKTPALYSIHGASINLAAAGHFDKSAFESMACETPVIVSSKAFEGIVPGEWIVPENDPEALADAMQRMVQLGDDEYRTLGAHERAQVVARHSLATLIDRLIQLLA